MSLENVEIVQRIYDGWATGHVGVAVPDFDPHVMIVVPASFLESGVYIGPDGIREYTHRFLEQYERVTWSSCRSARSIRFCGAQRALQRTPALASGSRDRRPWL